MMLKLLVVGGQWPPETFITRKLEGLAKAGVQVSVAANCKDARPKQLRGVRLIKLRTGDRNRILAIVRFTRNLFDAVARSPKGTWAVWKQCAAQSRAAQLRSFCEIIPLAGRRTDILHFEWNFAAVQYLKLFDLFDCPVVVSCRGTQAQVAPHNPARRVEAELLPVTFERASALHCVSKAIQGEVVKLGAAEVKTHVIRPAVDPDFFRPAGFRERENAEPFRIVTTGSVSWLKGYEYALQALRILVDRGLDARFTIIGNADKPDRQRLLYTIHDLRLAERVHLPGSLSPELVVSTLQQSDAFLLSSVSEGISNAVLEAMACGLPIVTTECGGMREAVTDAVEGFVTPVRNPERMADALERLACDPERSRAMGQRGRYKVIRDFQLSKQVESWVRLYTRLLKERRADAHPVLVGSEVTEV